MGCKAAPISFARGIRHIWIASRVRGADDEKVSPGRGLLDSMVRDPQARRRLSGVVRGRSAFSGGGSLMLGFIGALVGALVSPFIVGAWLICWLLKNGGQR